MAKNRQIFNKNPKKILIYGHHSVFAALINPMRKVKKAFFRENSEHLIPKELLKKVEKIEIFTKNKWKKEFSQYENNQGLILEAYNLIQPSIEKIFIDLKIKNSSIVLMLDQVKDPQNIGSIMRSAALFNCENIVTSKDNAPDLNSSIIKSSSGAAEKVNYIKVTNLVRCINEFKKNGFWVVGLDINAQEKIDKFKIPKKCLFVIGSENQGLRNLIKTNCDYLVSIEIKGVNNLGIDSLNVSNASTIALYEHFKNNK